MDLPKHLASGENTADLTQYTGNHRWGIIHFPLGDRNRDRLKPEYDVHEGYSLFEERGLSGPDIWRI
jgi:hypothetical protein